MEEVREIMLDNLNKANEREGKLGDLENRADQLLEQVGKNILHSAIRAFLNSIVLFSSGLFLVSILIFSFT